MSILRRFADHRLQRKISAQKTANAQLYKAFKREQARADRLAVNLKTTRTKLTEARKQRRAQS